MSQFLEACQKGVEEEYRQAAGKVIWVHDITAYLGKSDHQGDFHFRQPIRVRVCRNQDEEDLFRDMDGYFDPIWDVDIVDTKHPELPAEGLRSGWIYAPSYNLSTGEREKREIRFAEAEQISAEQNEAEEALCAAAKSLAQMGVDKETILRQIDDALAELEEQLSGEGDE